MEKSRIFLMILSLNLFSLIITSSLAGYGKITPLSETGSIEVKFMNYNIFWGGQNTEEVPNRDESWLDVIKEESPDVLVVNEAKGWHKDYGNLLSKYQKELNTYWRNLGLGEYNYAYATDKAFSGGDDDIGNLAILSRYEISNYTQIEEASVSGCYYTIPTHYFILADLKIGVEAVKLIGVHLKAGGGNIGDTNNRIRRNCEAQALMQIIDSFETDTPIFIMGDFNSYSPVDVAEPSISPNYTEATRVLSDSYELEFMGTEPVEYLLNASFVDTYRTLHLTERGYTFAAPEWTPAWPRSFFRIDYSFVSHHKAGDLLDGGVVNSSVALRASDHLPVWAMYQFDTPATTQSITTTTTTTRTITTEAPTSGFEFILCLITVIGFCYHRKKR